MSCAFGGTGNQGFPHTSDCVSIAWGIHAVEPGGLASELWCLSRGPVASYNILVELEPPWQDLIANGLQYQAVERMLIN